MRNGVPHLPVFRETPVHQQPEQGRLLPPAPGGPMSWWGKFSNMASDISQLVKLLGSQPSTREWIDSPPDAQSFDYQGVITTPTIGAGETTVLTVKVPIGWDGCILGISNAYLGVQTLDYSIPSLTWRIYIDLRPVSGYSHIITQFGDLSFPRLISPILVNSGQTLKYSVLNSDPGLPTAGTSVYCNFFGRFWPHRKS
jgi:hypothetical protein